MRDLTAYAGREPPVVTLQRTLQDWPQHKIRTARMTMWYLFDAHPVLRELDGIMSSMIHRADASTYAPRKRKFSVHFGDLPGHLKDAFQQMDNGYPGASGSVPVPSMIISMKTKVCEFIKAAEEAGTIRDICIASAVAYEKSLINRERPLSKKTMLSAIRQLRDFARFIDADEDVLDHFAHRIRMHENRSFGAIPQKEAKILLLPSYAEIFGRALDMLGVAHHTKSPRTAQALRNKAVAITLFCPFPLRVADTQLRMGKELLWDGTNYRFNLKISKSGRPYTAYILPVFGFFIDQLILQGSSGEHLEELRKDCIDKNRPLFVNYDDSAPHERYVSYLWSQVFGIGSHAARTHLHNSFGRLGSRGVELAMRACDHRSERTAEAYRTRAFEVLSLEKLHDDLAADFTDQEWQEFFGTEGLFDDCGSALEDHHQLEDL